MAGCIAGHVQAGCGSRLASLIKLRDLVKNTYNVNTLYILAVDDSAARRLAPFGEP